MAYIAYGAGANQAFPSVYQDPKYPKDIVINGILFDTDTMTPKVGSNVMAYTGNYGIGLTKSWGIIDDDDIYYFGIANNDATGMQYISIMTPNYPYTARDTKSTGVAYATTDALRRHSYWYCSMDVQGRDWLEHPLKITHLNNNLNQYSYMAPSFNEQGSRGFYDASGDAMMWQEGEYRAQGAGSGNFLYDAETTSGQLLCKPVNSASVITQRLYSTKYTTESQLHTTVDTELYAPTTTNTHFIHHLTKCNNGDHFFLCHEGYSNVGNGKNADLIRYDNSSDSVTVEYSNFLSAADWRWPLSVPSNVVYHQASGDSSTSKKICFYMSFQTGIIDSTAHGLRLITMDVANNTINRETCTYTVPAIASDDDDLANAGGDTGAGPDYYWDMRIISASQAINSQKYLFGFIRSTGNAAADHDRFYMLLKVNSTTTTTLTSVAGGTWDSLLTASSKVVNAQDKSPWCVAPLNTEHTLMMVFCKYSTHVIKLDTSTDTLSEVWMDDETVFTEAMWMPSGKVLTAQYNTSFAQGATEVDFHAPKPIQVWAEDLVYNVDIATSANYVEYAGSDVSNTLTISAYDGSNSRVATDLTLKIIGPAVFDNSTTTKTVTTSTSAGVTETITIQDDGQVEVKVVEIQSA